MEDIFSSNASEIIQKKLDVNEKSHINALDDDLDVLFDLTNVAKWVKDNGFKKIALQFPDELLHCSIRVSSRLQHLSSIDSKSYFILADTSYGSCCVDVVAAEHNDADAIIHFGHSCLSPVDKLPVFYVFEKFKLDIDKVVSEVRTLLGTLNASSTEKNHHLIILYDVSYFHLLDTLRKAFKSNPNVFVSYFRLLNKSQVLPVDQNVSSLQEKNKELFSRVLPNDLTNENEATRAAKVYSFFYIGNKESLLRPFLFYFNKLKFFQYENHESPLSEIAFAKTNRDLMKRFYLIERAKDAKIFGILIGTMSVSNFKQAIDHVANLLKTVKRRYYLFLIGKLNCPKLNNFMEVDMYVSISCNQNSLIDSKELNKPVITLYELEMAFNAARLWGNEFVCDFRLLLPNTEHFVPLQVSENESDVSLITGSIRQNALGDDETFSSKTTNGSQLMNRNEALSMAAYNTGAAEFMQKRSWTGLEQNLGQHEAKLAVDGRKGIAANYNTEPMTLDDTK